LDEFDVLRVEEIEPTVGILLSAADTKDHGRVYALLDPAVERFRDLDEEQRFGFKDAVDKFVRTYAFLSQVVSFGDSKLERDYVYCRALASRLRDENTATSLDLGSEVELTHLRSEVTFEGSLSLDPDEGEVKAIFGEGRGRQQELELEPLSQIVDELNERFGFDFDSSDQLLFDQFEETWLADPEVAAQAQNNTYDNFRLVFDRMFLGTLVNRMDDNEAIVRRVLDDEDFQAALKDMYATRVYRRARDGITGVEE
jgi:type I restriction enzyme R subunit